MRTAALPTFRKAWGKVPGLSDRSRLMSAMRQDPTQSAFGRGGCGHQSWNQANLQCFTPFRQSLHCVLQNLPQPE